MKRWFGGLSVAFVAVMFWLSPAQALTLGPGIQEFKVNPGQTADGYVEIKNDEAQARVFYLSIQKFEALGEQGQQKFLPLEDTAGLPSWIYFYAPRYSFAAGETRRIPFELKIPAEAEPGGHYAAIFFSALPPVTGADSSNASRVGSLVFLTVKGDVVERSRVTQFTVEPTNASRLPIDFQLRIENQGNVHLQPQGFIVVTNMFGSEVARLPINDAGARILPEQSRSFNAIWTKDDFVIGKYVAKYKSAFVSFWVVPWLSIGLTASFLVALIIITTVLLRRKRT